MAAPERQLILDALRQNNWRRDAAAKSLGINRATLYKKAKRLGVDLAGMGRINLNLILTRLSNKNYLNKSRICKNMITDSSLSSAKENVSLSLVATFAAHPAAISAKACDRALAESRDVASRLF